MAHRLKSSGRSRDQPILLPNLPPNLVTLPGPQRLAVIAYARAAEVIAHQGLSSGYQKRAEAAKRALAGAKAQALREAMERVSVEYKDRPNCSFVLGILSRMVSSHEQSAPGGK
jgi:hypothetical protein